MEKHYEYCKIIFYCVSVVLIFILSLFFLTNNLNNNFAYCENNSVYSEVSVGDVLKDITFSYLGKIYKLDDINQSNSEIQEELLKNYNTRLYALNFAINNGFDIEKAFLYSFPEIVIKVNQIEFETLCLPQNANYEVLENSAKLILNKCKNGHKIDKNELFINIFSNLNQFNSNNFYELNSKIIYPTVNDSDIEEITNLRSCFKTSFATSGQSRKNNIKTALHKFDGITLNPGEILSFNNQTGLRNESNGYQKAKIIKNGVFVEEYGGGVCQVSTTIYNAALLAGLEIVEVHPHSLPVSYIEPCFDAMVNMGSSDLVIRNNLDYPVIFTTSCKDDQCTVCVYGTQKDYDIIRKSEIIDDIPNGKSVYTDDYLKYGFTEPPADGEEKILSNSKPGYTAQSWLEFYKEDMLIKTVSLRKNTYNPTEQIILIKSMDK